MILSAKLVKREYSSNRDITLSFKNVFTKTITGIKFSWYGENAFSDPADMGGTVAIGFGGGFTDDAVKPGRADYGTWGIFSKDGKTIILA